MKWLQRDPAWSKRVTKVWKWADYPRAEGPDAGIDLVALIDGEPWAVQCKCISPADQIPKSQIDSFISASANDGYAGRMLIATTDTLSSNAKKVIRDSKVVFVSRDFLVNSPASWDFNKSTNESLPKKLEPKPHQLEAIKSVAQASKEMDRFQIIMACGTGKSLTALWSMEELDSNLTVVFVPSIGLVGQLINSWSSNSTKAWDFLAVCSDETVSEGVEEHSDGDINFGLPNTTDVRDISSFLKGAGRRVIFSTYHSSNRVAQAFRECGAEADLIIFDEAHRLAGKGDSERALLTQNDYLKSKKRIFMTATPRVFSDAAKKMAFENGFAVASMDDESAFGPVVFDLPFGEAIERGLLSDYKVVIVGTSEEELQKDIESGKLLESEATNIDTRTLANALGLRKFLDKYSLGKLITFHSSIRKAREFSNLQAQLIDIDGFSYDAEHVSGEMPNGRRRKLLSSLSSGTPEEPFILTNARCLTEGIDVPQLDGIGFMSPKSSQVDIVQAVGRAIRKSANKDNGYIFVPVLLNQVEGAPEVDPGSFKMIWKVINALKSHDASLAEELNQLRFNLGKTGESSFPEKVSVDLPTDLMSWAEQINRDLFTVVLERTSETWEYYFGLLSLYADSVGHARPSYNEEFKGFKLGRWVTAQRIKFSPEQSLDAEAEKRRARLESLPGWSWDQKEDDWSERYEILEEWTKENGKARPSDTETFRGDPIGRFVGTQRYRYRKGQLSQDRIDKLEGLPGWVWNKYEGDWEDYYDALVSFVESEGRLPSANSSNRQEKSLSWWIGTQKKNQNGLTSTKKQRLESIDGWIWERTSTLTWDSNFETVSSIITKVGSENLVVKRDIPSHLQNWLSNNRKASRQGELPEDRDRKIKSLGLDGNLVEAAWMASYRDLRNFYEHHGHLAFPQGLKTSAGKSLYYWLQKQREASKNGTLTAERQALLRGIGVTFVSNSTKWNEALSELKAYHKENGHILVHSKKDSYLFEWIVSQIKRKNQGGLTDHQAKCLEQIEGWSWVRQLHSFDVGVQMYLEHWESYGRKPAKDAEYLGFPLGRWVLQIRKLTNSGEMDKTTLDTVLSLPGWTGQ